MSERNRITLEVPGQARCRCGALLCKVVAASCVEVKCRRCSALLTIELCALAPPEVAKS